MRTIAKIELITECPQTENPDRWIPKEGESYTQVYFIIDSLKRGDPAQDPDFGEVPVFKTREVAQNAVSKMRELLLTLPQE